MKYADPIRSGKNVNRMVMDVNRNEEEILLLGGWVILYRVEVSPGQCDLGQRWVKVRSAVTAAGVRGLGGCPLLINTLVRGDGNQNCEEFL